jgi:hypothetical protein
VVQHNLNVINGTLDLNGRVLRLGDGTGVDNLTVTGRLDVDAGATLMMGNGARIQVNSGGAMNLVGASTSSRAMITAYNNGNYSFDVNSGANFAAKYYTIDYSDVNGLYIHLGAIVDPLQNLSEGIYSNGYPASGSYIILENDLAATDTIKNVTFNSGPLYNVTRQTGSTVFIFQDATGALGTYEYENDNGVPDPSSGLLKWIERNTYIWTGAVDTNWHFSDNWSSGYVPDATKSAIIPAGVLNFPNIYTAPAEVKTITVKPNATLTISNNLTVAQDFFYEGAVSAVGSPVITVSGNWSSTTGSFTPASSSVILNASSGLLDLLIGSSGSFYNLQIDAPSVTYKQGSALTISNNFNVSNGTFNFNNYDLTVGGDFIANGSLSMGNRLLTLNGTSGVHQFNSGSNVIYKLILNSSTGAASWLLNSNLQIVSDFTITKGLFDLSPNSGTTSYNLTIGKSYVNNGGSLRGRNATIKVGENWLSAGLSVFTSDNSVVEFVSVSASTRNIKTRSNAMYNMLLSGTSPFRLSDNLTISNNLTMNAGSSLDLATVPSYNLTLNGNWINNGTFYPRNGRVAFNGTVQSITTSSDMTFYQMTNNSNLTVNKNIAVQNNMILNGDIQLSSNKLTIGESLASPGSFTYTSGVVIGKMERWVTLSEYDYVFPVGTAGSPHLLTFRAISNLTSGSLLVEFIGSDPGNTGLPVTDGILPVIDRFTEGYWRTVANNGLASTDYDLSLSAIGFTSHELYGNTRILKRNDLSNWSVQGSHVDLSSNTAHRIGFNGISTGNTDFCLGFVDCIGGEIGDNQGICEDYTVAPFTNIITPAGGTSYSYVWYSTTNTSAVEGDSNWSQIASSNVLAYNHNATVSDTTMFIRKAVSTGCPDKYSNIIKVTLYYKPHPAGVYRKRNN